MRRKHTTGSTKTPDAAWSKFRLKITLCQQQAYTDTCVAAGEMVKHKQHSVHTGRTQSTSYTVNQLRKEVAVVTQCYCQSECRLRQRSPCVLLRGSHANRDLTQHLYVDLFSSSYRCASSFEPSV